MRSLEIKQMMKILSLREIHFHFKFSRDSANHFRVGSVYGKLNLTQ